MSERKGAPHSSARLLKEHRERIQDEIEPRQPAHPERSKRIASLMRNATVVAAFATLAIGGGSARAAVAAPMENYLLTKPLGISTASAAAPSSLLVVAQSQDSATPPDDEVPQSQQEGPAPAAPASVAPHPRAATRSEPNEHLSSDLSEYLHQHHLPFVDAMVFSNASGRPTLVKLSGQVRTEHGKEDAETKSSDFLNQPGLRVQNHIEVDAGLASTAPASSSASVVPAASAGAATAAPIAAANPCTDLCLKDEGHCNTACQTQAAGGATGGGGLQGLLGQFGQSATALKQCNDQCVQTREHCTYDCSQAASAGPAPEGADSSGPPPSTSDHQAEGPDTPPE